MFLAETLTVLTKAVQASFDGNFPVEDFRNIHASIEYPAEEQNYPGIWIGFEPEGTLSIAGIGHREFVENEDDATFGERTRWRFEGKAVFTLVSLTSLARARLLDEVVRVIGFGHLEQGRGGFREFIETNQFIGLDMIYDSIAIRGMAETPGTPWGTDDIIYEVSLATNVVGEFTSTPSGELVALSEINVFYAAEGQPDPRPGPGWT